MSAWIARDGNGDVFVSGTPPERNDEVAAYYPARCIRPDALAALEIHLNPGEMTRANAIPSTERGFRHDGGVDPVHEDEA